MAERDQDVPRSSFFPWVIIILILFALDFLYEVSFLSFGYQRGWSRRYTYLISTMVFVSILFILYLFTMI